MIFIVFVQVGFRNGNARGHLIGNHPLRRKIALLLIAQFFVRLAELLLQPLVELVFVAEFVLRLHIIEKLGDVGIHGKARQVFSLIYQE